MPELIPEMPLPLPKFEIFVYSPRVEGVHLRGGKVARGGLRWSDRQEDFRTEVLGLVKAQQVAGRWFNIIEGLRLVNELDNGFVFNDTFPGGYAYFSSLSNFIIMLFKKC